MRHECAWCGDEFEGQRSAKFCSATCRGRNHKAKPHVPSPMFDPAAHPLVKAVKAELGAAGRLETPDGFLAVRVAELMAEPSSGGSALAGLSKELSRTMAAALKDAPVGKLAVVRPPDELTYRRTTRRKRGFSTHNTTKGTKK